METIVYNNTDENRFWLQIMGDYARMLYDALPPSAAKEIQEAAEFITLFDNLLARSHQYLSVEELAQLNKDAYAGMQKFHEYLLNLLRMQLTESFFLFYKPVIISNAISFAEEYMYLLDSFINGKQPLFSPTGHQVFWLPFFTELARSIEDSSGIYQFDIRKRADEFALIFQNLSSSALALQGSYRIGTIHFPIADQQQKDVEKALRDFQPFLAELISLVQQSRMPGILSITYLDRSYRLLCYYLTQITTLNNTEKPNCDPSRPRLSLTQYSRI